MEWRFDQVIDLARPGGVKEWPDLLMVAGDHQAHAWRVTVTQDGVPVPLDGYSIFGYFDKADGLTVPVQGTANGNTAVLVMPQAVYTATGPVVGLLRAEKDTQVLTLALGRWHVHAGPGDQLIDPEGLVPDVEQLMLHLGEMQRQAQAARDAAAAANAAATGIDDKVAAANEEITSKVAGLRDMLLAPPAMELLVLADLAEEGKMTHFANFWMGEFENDHSIYFSRSTYYTGYWMIAPKAGRIRVRVRTSYGHLVIAKGVEPFEFSGTKGFPVPCEPGARRWIKADMPDEPIAFDAGDYIFVTSNNPDTGIDVWMDLWQEQNQLSEALVERANAAPMAAIERLLARVRVLEDALGIEHPEDEVQMMTLEDDVEPLMDETMPGDDQ